MNQKNRLWKENDNHLADSPEWSVRVPSFRPTWSLINDHDNQKSTEIKRQQNNTKKLSLLVIPFSAVIGDEESRVEVTLTTLRDQ